MAKTPDEHEIHHWENEGGCISPDGDQERADAALAAAGQKPSAEEALETFAKHANWSLLHPCDDERFETFMRVATAAKWTSMEVEARLVQLGLPEELCQRLRRRYWNRTRPLPTAGTKMDKELAELNARLTRRNASA